MCSLIGFGLLFLFFWPLAFAGLLLLLLFKLIILPFKLIGYVLASIFGVGLFFLLLPLLFFGCCSVCL